MNGLNKLNKKLFFTGLVLFYVIIFFAPSKPVYFLAYAVSTYFFYQATGNIAASLLFSLVLSLFSNVGLAASLFLMEPEFLKLGSGFAISPATIIVGVLIPLSLFRKGSKLHPADIFLILFLLWTIVSFYFNPYTNTFLGVVSLGEVVLIYFLLRIHLTAKNMKYIAYLLISMIIFQFTVGTVQIGMRRPLRIETESLSMAALEGTTAVENEGIFRIAGTFGHPNFLASFLLAISPFLFFYKFKSSKLFYLKLLPLAALFFTFSRAAWFILLSIFIFTVILKKDLISEDISILKKNFIYFFPLLLLFLTVETPFLISRLESLPLAFKEQGVMTVRYKLWTEGLNTAYRYFLTGVGLNRSLEYYLRHPTTNIFWEFNYNGFNLNLSPSSFYKIHNTFIEIAAETGVVGFGLFAMFIFQVYASYFSAKSKGMFRTSAVVGLTGLAAISLFNPFLHSTQMRFFSLLAPLILMD